MSFVGRGCAKWTVTPVLSLLTVAVAAAPVGRQLLAVAAKNSSQQSSNVVSVFGTVTKHPANPLYLIGQQPGAVPAPTQTPYVGAAIYSSVLTDASGLRAGPRWRGYFTASLVNTTSGYETGTAGLVYAVSDDGIAWQPGLVGIPWPNTTDHNRSNILTLTESGTAVFEDTNPATMAATPPSEWSLVIAGQLTFNDSSMHNGGSGWMVRSSDGVHLSSPPTRINVEGGRTPGARWDTETNGFYDRRTGRYVFAMRAPRDPKCGIWWPLCLGHCASCGAGNLTDRDNGLVSVRAVSVMQSAGPELGSLFTDVVAAVNPFPERQLYAQVTFPLPNLQIYIGLVMVADVFKEVQTGPGFFKGAHVNRVHCAVQWSVDLVEWFPVANLTDFIPLSPSGWDSHLCYATAAPIVMPDGAVRVYYSGSDGPHDGVNKTSRLGLATLAAVDRFVGFGQASTSTVGTIRATVVCQGAQLLVGSDLGRNGSLRAGSVGIPGLTLDDAVTMTAADAKGPDLAVRFNGGATFAAHVGSEITLELELNGGAAAFSVAWEA
eukprot:m.471214 g.471214  ORF g.471214 m.471214 type:complete len:547 (-) comp30735_c0_seq1:195-1835(-)